MRITDRICIDCRIVFLLRGFYMVAQSMILNLAAFGRVSPFLQRFELRARLPVDDLGGGSARFAGIVQWTPSPWPRSVTPGFEVTVTEFFDSEIDTLVTVNPQLYFGLSKLGHVALSVGVQVPITDVNYDYRIHTFLLWDIADGPLWAGW